jgi:D-beta-D-heptose 7-phosphate kinase/D-beta-D-heptose 1-phosphate adenosyltransferase
MSVGLARIVDQFASKRVLVLGDAMLDSYLVGTSTRLCQEAPVPVIAVHQRLDCPGGAANTAVNLAGLGCQVELVSVVGLDHEGARLRRLLRQRGVGTDLLAASAGRQTLSKQRIVNGGQQIARLDQGDTGPIPADVERRLLSRLGAAFVRADAVVVSDYGYGVLTPGLLARLRTLQARFQQLLAVDARDLARYRPVGVTLVKPNYDEMLRLAGAGPPPAGATRAAQAVEHGQTVLDRSGARIAAITLDAEGAVVLERDRQPYRTVAGPADQARTAGAGDTYLAALSLALASGATTGHAAEIAAYAAAVVVGRDGTAACTDAELRREIARATAALDGYRPRSATATASAPAETIVHGEGDGQGDPADLGERQAPALRQA